MPLKRSVVVHSLAAGHTHQQHRVHNIQCHGMHSSGRFTARSYTLTDQILQYVDQQLIDAHTLQHVIAYSSAREFRKGRRPKSHLSHAFLSAGGGNDVVGHSLRWQPAGGAARVGSRHCTQNSHASAYCRFLGDEPALPHPVPRTHHHSFGHANPERRERW